MIGISQFQPKFFEDSPTLLQGFQKLVFGHGLDYAYSSSTLPNQVSCWLFCCLSINYLMVHFPRKAFSAMQLVQVLMNHWACFETIFANGHDYQ